MCNPTHWNTIAAKYGGVYIDSDMISMGNMRHWYDLLKYYDIVSIDWAPEGTCRTILPNPNLVDRSNTFSCRCSTVDRCNRAVACEQYDRSEMETVATCYSRQENTRLQKQTKRLSDPMGRDVQLPTAGHRSADVCQRVEHVGWISVLSNQWCRNFWPMANEDVRATGCAPSPFVGNSNCLLTGSQLRRLNLPEEYFLYESEMSMYFGSGLHGWDGRNVHDFLNEDFGIVEYLAQSMKRCREKKSTNTLDVIDRKRRVVFKTGPFVKLTIDDDDLRQWIMQFMCTHNLLTAAERNQTTCID
jgi:hypothetical protein